MNTLISHLPTATRVLLGLIFLVFGLNGFLHFLPMPPVDGKAATYMGGLAATGYFFPLLKGTEVAIGAALLANRFVPLALTVLAPITIQILAYQSLAPDGLPLALLILGLHLGLAWRYRDAYRGLLSPRYGSSAPAAS